MVKQICDILPNRITKDEIALAPIGSARSLSDYANRRKKAVKEIKPGYNSLVALILAAIAKRDKSLIDIATEMTKENVPRYVYLTIVGSALCDLGSKLQGLEMLREATKLDPSHFILLNLAAETDDLNEKENLAKKVIDENPKDCDALRHLAYAKCSKGEYEEAERLVDEILSNDPNNIFAHEFKGNIYLDKKEYQKALQQYLSVKLNPLPISLQLKICRCYYLVGKIRKAKKIAKNIKDKIAYVSGLECTLERAQEILTEVLDS